MAKAKEEFHLLHRFVIINKPTIYDQIEDDKRRTIKRIMAIVDTQVDEGQVHGHIRKAVLDGVNDMARSFCLTLDRVVAKIEPVEEGDQEWQSTSTTTSSPSTSPSTET